MTYLFQPFTNPDLFKNYIRKRTEDIRTKDLSLTHNFEWKLERREIFSIVALAEPILDIISDIDESILKEYDLKWGSTVLINEKDDKTEKIFEHFDKMPNVEYVPGGSAQNSVRVLKSL